MQFSKEPSKKSGGKSTHSQTPTSSPEKNSHYSTILDTDFPTLMSDNERSNGFGIISEGALRKSTVTDHRFTLGRKTKGTSERRSLALYTYCAGELAVSSLWT